MKQQHQHPVRGLMASGRVFAFSLALLASAACAGGDTSSDTTPTAPVPNAPAGRPVLAPTYRPTGHAASGDVFVQLFEWSWPDVATECERVLGPAGYRAALVSPPQEHISLVAHPWWERYQPVSYSLGRSRSGTASEFTAMVARCRAANVDIYVDAVINHMTAGSGTGTNGTVYTKYQYPGLYTSDDFHNACTVSNYSSAQNVQDCELVGLADLRTDSPTVQQKIADYLIALARQGVAGFRIDAAKHIQPVELDGIIGRVNRALSAEGKALPYVFLEVIDPGTEAVKAADYLGMGYASGGAADITEFKFRGIGDKFLAGTGQRPADLSTFSQSAWALMSPDKAVVFLQNHDTQRSGGLDYRDGTPYRLAYTWMLGQPYGYPVVMSGYAFDRGNTGGRDQGPPTGGGGVPDGVPCAVPFENAIVGQWTCEHRDPMIARMVAFRRAVAGADLNSTWDDGANAVAYTRGTSGFVAINNGTASTTASIPTKLPAGTYCDILTGGKAGSACAGRSVVVSADSRIAITLDARSAVALLIGQRP